MPFAYYANTANVLGKRSLSNQGIVLCEDLLPEVRQPCGTCCMCHDVRFPTVVNDAAFPGNVLNDVAGEGATTHAQR